MFAQSIHNHSTPDKIPAFSPENIQRGLVDKADNWTGPAEIDGPAGGVIFSLCGVDIIANIVPIEAVERTKNICILFEKTDNILKRESLIRQGLRRRSFNTRYTIQSAPVSLCCLLQ